MMVLMRADASAQDIQAVCLRLEAEGLHAHPIQGELSMAIGALGDPSAVEAMSLEAMRGVDHVVRITPPYKLASLQARRGARSTVMVAGRPVGPGYFTLIAGPCTVESRQQTLLAARQVKEGGASLLRGGAFKPRTSPFAFQGMGEEALEVLEEARACTGLGLVSEATSLENLAQVARVVDMIQIGARNMQNYALLAAAGQSGRPVLLKRGLSSSCEELLMAADYILKEGNQQVILCERGIRTFERATRFTLDLGAVAWLSHNTHLPVIVDPSHAPGRRDMVEALACAAAAVGADGLIVEVTPHPESARCDGPQQLPSAHFPAFARRVFAHARLQGREPSPQLPAV